MTVPTPPLPETNSLFSVMGQDGKVDKARLETAFAEARRVVKETFEREAALAIRVPDVMNLRLRG